MTIERITHSIFELVELLQGTPHCKSHGVMNKTTKDGFWRCITVTGYDATGRHKENICRAGCKKVNIKV